jgi:hypothetical protein
VLQRVGTENPEQYNNQEQNPFDHVASYQKGEFFVILLRLLRLGATFGFRFSSGAAVGVVSAPRPQDQKSTRPLARPGLVLCLDCNLEKQLRA